MQETTEKHMFISKETRDTHFGILMQLVTTHLPKEFSFMLESLAEDRKDDSGQEYLGFKNAPAGKGNHHAYLGGLCEHLLEMWEFWRLLKPGIGIPEDPNQVIISDKSVLVAIIMHDLHKSWFTFTNVQVNNTGLFTLQYGDHASNSLFTNDQKSMYIATSHGILLDAFQINCLHNSEGGFAKSPPKWQTTLAKFVYVLDELSSNVLARTLQGNHFDVRKIRHVSLSDVHPVNPDLAITLL